MLVSSAPCSSARAHEATRGLTALIIARTGRAPKTHSSLRSEFARLAREEPRISREQVSFLGWSYELKNAADYEQDYTVSSADVRRAIDEALQLVAALVTPPTGERA